MGWKVQICDGDDNIYICRAEQVTHKWASAGHPCGGGIEDVQFYRNAIYCVDKEAGRYWRGRLPCGYRGGSVALDWEDLGGEGGSRICVGEGFLFAYCYCDPGRFFRSESPGTGGGNEWTGFDLPEEGLRGWSMYDGELYFTCGENGHYYKTNCRNVNPRKMYGDGGFEIACGAGYIIASATDPCCDADEAMSLYIGHIGRRVGVDYDCLGFRKYATVPGGINSISIYNGNCHILSKTWKGDDTASKGGINLALPVEGCEDFAEDPDAWCECGGEGGWKHHVAGKKTHGGGYKGGRGHHGAQRRNWEDECDWDDFSSSDDYSDSDDDWD